MSDSRAEDEAAIQAVLVDSYKAWEAGDADGMVANYTADATAIMTGSLRVSRDVIRESMALAFEGPLNGSSTYNKLQTHSLQRSNRSLCGPLSKHRSSSVSDASSSLPSRSRHRPKFGR